MNILGISNFTGKVVALDIESAQAVYNNNSITVAEIVDKLAILWGFQKKPWSQEFGIHQHEANYLTLVEHAENLYNINTSKNYTGTLYNNIYKKIVKIIQLNPKRLS